MSSQPELKRSPMTVRSTIVFHDLSQLLARSEAEAKCKARGGALYRGAFDRAPVCVIGPVRVLW